MVISQIAGLATAFGTGELSGAGFGPNYTILMKLGYEFFAPRILEEMEKNPNVYFQDTLWFQKFQKQIKLYSDKVMEQTLDTLLHIPQKTIDAIDNKFQGGGIIPQNPNIPISVSPAFNRINTLNQVAQNIDAQPFMDSITNFFNSISKIFPSIPQAFGEDTPPINTGSGTQNTRTLISLTRIQLQRWRFEDLNNAMSAITKNNSPYDGTTQGIIRDLWNKGRTRIGTTQTKQRQTTITTFQKVTIPKSNIPTRSTKRPAGQSVKLERDKLSREILAAAKSLTAHQKIFRNIRWGSGQSQSTRQNIINRGKITENKLIILIKTKQQKLTFLLNNYTF